MACCFPSADTEPSTFQGVTTWAWVEGAAALSTPMSLQLASTLRIALCNRCCCNSGGDSLYCGWCRLFCGHLPARDGGGREQELLRVRSVDACKHLHSRPRAMEWTSDSNSALTLSLVRAAADQASLADDENYTFHPRFTYPIYGDDEKIYGYEGLVIDAPQIRVGLSRTVPQHQVLQEARVFDGRRRRGHPGQVHSPRRVSTVSALFQTTPVASDYYQDEIPFLQRVEADAKGFRPPGEVVYTYTRLALGKEKESAPLGLASEDAITYEVFHATWESPGFRELHRRMQLFILLYIEAGSYIDETEETWEFVLLYEKRKRRDTPDVATYHFVGYSALYPFYCFPDRTRLRLSQFVILPPYQRAGHGSELYNAIYQNILTRPRIAELTVEDPAEAFEDLRDKNDLLMLLGHQRFMEEAIGAASHGGGRAGGVGKGGRSGRGGASGSAAAAKGKMGPPADKAWVEKWRSDLKMAQRQFQRLIEMLILLRLDPTDELGMRAYRLQVKERLYRFNFEVLAQLDKQERLDKLEQTFQGVRDDYLRILALLSH
ncbi:Histone acetyltransferase type B catalytic subunit [Mycena kentingensis (nom. inval.)]|nr:Histone acetyltransferase type B catalytic subunit [Mycena kentingensis (nom. inval.)]